MRGEVPYLRLLPLGFGIVAPLALAYASGVVLYFVLSRYRLPGVPPLILLAAAAAAAVKLAALLFQAARPCEALPLLVRARERAPGPEARARLEAAIAELERTCGSGAR